MPASVLQTIAQLMGVLAALSAAVLFAMLVVRAFRHIQADGNKPAPALEAQARVEALSREARAQTAKVRQRAELHATKTPLRARLTEGHRRVLIVAAVLALLMLLFPPWWTPAGTGSFERAFFRGYAPIVYRPPRAESIAWPILAVELVALALVAGAALVLLPRVPRVCPLCGARLLPVTRIIQGRDRRVAECVRNPATCSYSSRIELARWG